MLKAIIFADRLGQELRPLTDRTSVAMLTIATKPLINYTFEMLLTAGVREVIVICAAHSIALRRNIDDGARWGIKVEFWLARGEEPPSSVLNRHLNLLTEERYLLVRGDILFGFSLQSFVQQALALPEDIDSVHALVNQQMAGVSLIKTHAWKMSDALHWYQAKWQATPQLLEAVPRCATLHLVGNVATFANLQAYYQANQSLFNGEFPELVVTGRDINQYLRVGHRSEFSEHHQGMIGMFCHVHNNAQLVNSMIGNYCIIDSGAILENTIVLSHTYIGQDVVIRNALVWGEYVILLNPLQIKNLQGEYQAIDLTRANFRVLEAEAFHRGLGLLTLICSLPLWIVAIIVSFIAKPLAPIKKMRFLGNRRDLRHQELQAVVFSSYEFATSVPILRHLPRLWAVVTGHIRFIGVSPQSPEVLASRQDQWQFMRDNSPVGLLGPYQLGYLHTLPELEAEIQEAHYASIRGFREDLNWLYKSAKALLSAKTWLPHR